MSGLMSQYFEQALVGGRAHWIKSFAHEPALSRLTVFLTDDVDSANPTRSVEFLEVEQVDIIWTDRDDNHHEGLLGAHEEEHSGQVHYMLVTEQREITITARRRAVVHTVR